MGQSRLVGGLICIGILVVAALLIWGLAVQSYWALAVPVIVGTFVVLSLGFWIGWTMLITKIEAPKPEAGEK
jgi:hypothetical protein